jgi:hypothetical protein
MCILENGSSKYHLIKKEFCQQKNGVCVFDLTKKYYVTLYTFVINDKNKRSRGV